MAGAMRKMAVYIGLVIVLRVVPRRLRRTR